MEKNKEIGKLFKEKLDDLDRSPNDFKWNNIKEDLDKKRNKKIAFWIFSSVLCIALITGVSYQINSKLSKNEDGFSIKNATNGNSNRNINVTKIDNSLKDATKIDKENIKSENYKSDQGLTSKDLADSIKTKSSKTSSEVKKSYKNSRKLIKSTEEYDVYEVTKKYEFIVKKKKTTVFTSKVKEQKKGKSSDFLSKTNKKSKPYLLPKIKDLTTNPAKIKSKNQKVSSKTLNRNSMKVKNFNKSKQNSKSKNIDEKNVNALKKSEKSMISNAEFIETEIATNSKTDSIKKTSLNSQKIKNIEKKSLKNLKPKDSAETVFLEPIEKQHKYYVSPFYGLNYYSVFNRNNLSAVFKDNLKTSSFTPTYGVFVRVMFNDKIGIRSGFAISNLQNTTAIDKTSQPILGYSILSLSQFYDDATLKNIFLNDTEILLTQKLNYFEMPLELYYVWKDQKFGLAANFGFSMLLENQNFLTLKSNSVSEFNIGYLRDSSTYVNSTVNLGFYFTYKFNERINFDLSPQFKYQLFGTEKAEGLQPIILSLQTGVSYKIF